MGTRYNTFQYVHKIRMIWLICNHRDGFVFYSTEPKEWDVDKRS